MTEIDDVFGKNFSHWKHLTLENEEKNMKNNVLWYVFDLSWGTLSSTHESYAEAFTHAENKLKKKPKGHYQILKCEAEVFNRNDLQVVEPQSKPSGNWGHDEVKFEEQGTGDNSEHRDDAISYFSGQIHNPRFYSGKIPLTPYGEACKANRFDPKLIPLVPSDVGNVVLVDGLGDRHLMTSYESSREPACVKAGEWRFTATGVFKADERVLDIAYYYRLDRK